jgi:hypothetical protein
MSGSCPAGPTPTTTRRVDRLEDPTWNPMPERLPAELPADDGACGKRDRVRAKPYSSTAGKARAGTRAR